MEATVKKVMGVVETRFAATGHLPEIKLYKSPATDYSILEVDGITAGRAPKGGEGKFLVEVKREAAKLTGPRDGESTDEPPGKAESKR